MITQILGFLQRRQWLSRETDRIPASSCLGIFAISRPSTLQPESSFHHIFHTTKVQNPGRPLAATRRAVCDGWNAREDPERRQLVPRIQPRQSLYHDHIPVDESPVTASTKGFFWCQTRTYLHLPHVGEDVTKTGKSPNVSI